MLIVLVRLKFEKRFRRRWINNLPSTHYYKKILVGPSWKSHTYMYSSIKSVHDLNFNQATLFYYIDRLYEIRKVDETEIADVISFKTLTQIPDPLTEHIWFDREINRSIRYSLEGRIRLRKSSEHTSNRSVSLLKKPSRRSKTLFGSFRLTKPKQSDRNLFRGRDGSPLDHRLMFRKRYSAYQKKGSKSRELSPLSKSPKFRIKNFDFIDN